MAERAVCYMIGLPVFLRTELDTFTLYSVERIRTRFRTVRTQGAQYNTYSARSTTGNPSERLQLASKEMVGLPVA